MKLARRHLKEALGAGSPYFARKAIMDVQCELHHLLREVLDAGLNWPDTSVHCQTDSWDNETLRSFFGT